MPKITRFFKMLILPLVLWITVTGADKNSAVPEDRDNTVTIEGVLRLYGNEPFTKIALVTDEEARYYLHADDKLLSRLWSESDGRIRITGNVFIKKHLGRPAKFIDLEAYEWIVECNS